MPDQPDDPIHYDMQIPPKTEAEKPEPKTAEPKSDDKSDSSNAPSA